MGWYINGNPRQKGGVEPTQLQKEGGGTNHLLDRGPFQGGDEGIPSRGLPRKGRDADGDESIFLAQTCMERRDHLGGGKFPSSKVPTMRHAGIVEVPKWEAQRGRGGD